MDVSFPKWSTHPPRRRQVVAIQGGGALFFSFPTRRALDARTVFVYLPPDIKHHPSNILHHHGLQQSQRRVASQGQ